MLRPISTDAQRTLVLENMQYAKNIAVSDSLRSVGFLDPAWDADEAISCAYLGLVEAAARFDPSRGASFKTFAKHRIAGAIRDGARGTRAHTSLEDYDYPEEDS